MSEDLLMPVGIKRSLDSFIRLISGNFSNDGSENTNWEPVGLSCINFVILISFKLFIPISQ